MDNRFVQPRPSHCHRRRLCPTQSARTAAASCRPMCMAARDPPHRASRLSRLPVMSGAAVAFAAARSNLPITIACIQSDMLRYESPTVLRLQSLWTARPRRGRRHRATRRPRSAERATPTVANAAPPLPSNGFGRFAQPEGRRGALAPVGPNRTKRDANRDTRARVCELLQKTDGEHSYDRQIPRSANNLRDAKDCVGRRHPKSKASRDKSGVSRVIRWRMRYKRSRRWPDCGGGQREPDGRAPGAEPRLKGLKEE